MKVLLKTTVYDRIVKDLEQARRDDRAPDCVVVTQNEYAELRADGRTGSALYPLGRLPRRSGLGTFGGDDSRSSLPRLPAGGLLASLLRRQVDVVPRDRLRDLPWRPSVRRPGRLLPTMSALKTFWTWLQSLGAPVETPVVLAPVAPLAQEQFANAARTTAAARQERTTTLYERVVRANNAYVARNYGFGNVVLHDDRSVAPIALTERKEMTDLGMDVRFCEERVVDPVTLDENAGLTRLRGVPRRVYD
jgi:hypothetical protein